MTEDEKEEMELLIQIIVEGVRDVPEGLSPADVKESLTHSGYSSRAIERATWAAYERCLIDIGPDLSFVWVDPEGPVPYRFG